MFSIIVPVYNVAPYLENCLQSLINQTYTNFEVLLVDDGSTDNSLEICKNHEKQHPNIKVFHQENNGQGSARNLALKHAQGDYILFIDSDDAIALDTLEKNHTIIQEYPTIDFVQFPVFQKYGTSKEHITQGEKGLIIGAFYENWLIHKRISWIACDKIFKRELFEKVQFEEGIFYEDNLLIAHILNHVEQVYIGDVGLYYYYDRAGSTTTSPLNLKREKDSFYVTYRIFQVLKEKNMYDKATDFLVRLINIRKSLKVNFNYEAAELKKEDGDFLKWSRIFQLNLPQKDKIKLLLFKLKG